MTSTVSANGGNAAIYSNAPYQSNNGNNGSLATGNQSGPSINFDEIFNEVKQSTGHPSQQSNGTYTNFGTSASNYSTPQPAVSVFDSRTLTQLNNSFSLDDLVRYEMTRAVVEKQKGPAPPSRPPLPPSTNSQQSQLSINPISELDPFYSNTAPGTTLQNTFSPPTQSRRNSNLSPSGIARPRPQPSLPQTPSAIPLVPTKVSPRSASMNFADFGQGKPVAGANYGAQAQLLPAYKPEPQKSNSSLVTFDDGNRSKRDKIVEELISTEESYLADLQLCCDVVRSTKCPPVGAGFACQISPEDNHPLLGNMQEVADVSRRLLDSLKTEAAKSKGHQMIGSCFIKATNDLESAYSRYCQHQPGAAAFLNRLNQVDATKNYVQNIVDSMKAQRSSAFSLESLMLKPVQRILKYPLLLSELSRNTEPQHPDTEALASASSLLSKLTGRLNETRRRLDLVLKYRKSPSLTSRLSRAINPHTIGKKTARFGQRLRDSITFSSAGDEDFMKKEQEFQQSDKMLRQVVRLLQRWTDAYNEYAQAQREVANLINEFSSNDTASTQINTFRDQWQRVFDTGLTSVRIGKVNALSIDPLKQLIELHGGPSNVIKKRQDKLLDYRRLSGNTESNPASDNELAIARTDFLAIDAQLADELPSLCRFTYRIILLALVSCLRHYSAMCRSSANNLHPVVEKNLALANLATASQKMNTFSFVKPDQKNLFSSGSKTSDNFFMPSQTSRSGSISSYSSLDASTKTMSSNDPSLLRSKYAASDLYVVSEPTISKGPMELSLPSTTLVGVIKKHDPNGQSEKWFVDTGSAKGFVPKRSLKSFTQSPSVDAMLMNFLD